MLRERIQVYTDPETKRRIELAAAKRDMAVTEYCLIAIKEQLSEEALLEEERVTIYFKPRGPKSVIGELRSLQERILARRSGDLIDVDRILNQVRDERDEELTDLH